MSEEKNIDAFFKTVLDRPVEGVDPTPAWESFERMAAGMQSTSPNSMIYKASWLGAIASFMLMTLLSVFDRVELNTTEHLHAEQSFRTLPIVRFNSEEDKTLESSMEHLPASNQNASIVRDMASLNERPSEKMNQALEGMPESDDYFVPEQSKTQLAANKGILAGMTTKALLLDLSASDQDIETSLAQEKSPQAISHFNRNRVRLIVSSNTFDALIASGSVNSSNALQSIGLEFQRQLSPKLSASVGFAYAHRAMPGFENAYDSVSFSFGSTTHRKTIRSKYTQNLLLPISLSYYPSPKHEIQTGVELAYLLDVHSEISESILGHENELPVIREYVGGYRNGFNDFQTSALLAYRYQISQAIQLGINGRYAISDAVNADQFDRKGQLNAFNWQVQLTYKLRDF